MSLPKLPAPIHILSLGAGVQSSTIALMAAKGEITPMPIAAVFSDTKAEPPSVYTWLDWLITKLPYQTYKVTRGSLVEISLTVREHQKKPGTYWSKSLIPAFVANQDGTRGIMGRACTADFKIGPLVKKTKELIGAPAIKDWKRRHAVAYKAFLLSVREKRTCPSIAWDEMQADPLAVQWIGISWDEIQRMKPSWIPFVKHRWPLIEMEMRREHCLVWMLRNKYPEPPRSACEACPFHSDTEWRRLKDNEPESFARAVKFERDLQDVKRRSDNMGGVPFLHNSLQPLDQVDFSTDVEKGQGLLHGFGNECEGLCGV